MLAGYYTIASGLLTRQRQLDVIGNNLTNIQTPGYRADRLLISDFQQELLTRQEAGRRTTLGAEKASTSAVAEQVVPLFQEGTIKQTGQSTDVAINGAGFFNIQAKDGTVSLTRNGQFGVDGEGYLMLPGFGRVLGDGGPIHVGGNNFSVQSDGSIYSMVGTNLGRLRVTVPPEGAALIKQENGMLQFPAGVAGTPSTNYSVLQKSLELSNVNMTQELTDMIAAQRAFQACSSALQMVDALNRKAASQLGAL
ncbi:MAG: flagellar hook-basal body protein [Ruthenibacterium sp.]